MSLSRHARATRRRLYVESLEDRTVPASAIGLSPALAAPASPSGGQHAPRDLSDTFELHSLPGAQHVIYLDFDGHLTAGTSWNNSARPAILSPPFDISSNGSNFSSEELERIQHIWQRVAEDFIPFDVDVTTEEPDLEQLASSGIRVVVGGNSAWLGPVVGGAAKPNSFGSGIDVGCFIFEENLGNGQEKPTAEAISHQVGQTLGLSRDGRDFPGTLNDEVFYAGHGSGATSWAPIMGLGYYRELTQWSRGEYGAASQTQNDLAIITTQNGFGYRPDDHGNAASQATSVNVIGPNDFTAVGIIEKSTDTDVFSFRSGAGPISLIIAPAERGANLDVLAELYDAAGNKLASANPANALSATIALAVPVGDYFLKIDGVGRGDPKNGGYSDYGSLGQYTITGVVPDPPPPIPLHVNDVATIESAAGLVTHFRMTFNVLPNLASLPVSSIRVTGPTGAHVPVIAVRTVTGKPTALDFLIQPQRLTGNGGVRIFLPPSAAGLAALPLDQDGDNIAGELEDFYAAAAHTFYSDQGGSIADDGTVNEFALAVPAEPAVTIRDVNVRVDITHDYVGDLRMELESPTGITIPLLLHRGGDGNDLHNTRFDDESTRALESTAAPFTGVFKPDGGALSAVDDLEALGTWKLRVVDAYAGAAGQLNSWGLTFTTDKARSGPTLVSATANNELASAFAKRTSGMILDFDRSINTATLSSADIRVVDPFGLPVRVLSVVPAAGSDHKRFLVSTATWTRAGTYHVRVGPAVADVYGNGLDGNGNGRYAEPGDAFQSTHELTNHLFATRQRSQAIPRGGSVTSAIVVGPSINIADIAIELNVQHANAGDLKVILIAPDGTEIVLANRRGGAGAGFVRTIFSASATTNIADGSAPFRGDFAPEDVAGMSALSGTNAKGAWKLRVEDAGTGAVGRLLSWSLFVTP